MVTVPTTHIRISEEAKRRLERRKRNDESFTDVVLRLTASDGDRMDGFGAMADAEGFRAAVERTRDGLDSDLRERGTR